jgi:hypothetical protein
MKAKELISILSQEDNDLHIMLPNGDFVPAHFHITEVGRVDKNFVDCGGTKRTINSCVLQVWVAGDIEHRLKSGKLAKIMAICGDRVGKIEDLSVEIEFQNDSISVYPLEGIELTPKGFLLHTSRKHTACLAPDKCGITGCC